jgi:hypothetical protein
LKKHTKNTKKKKKKKKRIVYFSIYQIETDTPNQIEEVEISAE